METAPPSPAPAPSIWQIRDFRLFLTGRFMAMLGQQMLTIAVGWELYDRTHSALNLGLVGLTQFLPMLLATLPSGYVADNFPRKRVIIAMQSVLCVCALGLATVSHFKADIRWVYACLFVSGLARTFLASSSASFLPLLVPRELFPKAVMWSSSTFQISAVAGPALGGLLVLFNPRLVYLLTATGALVYVTFMCFVKTHHHVAARQTFSPRSLLAGFRFVVETPLVFGTITLDLFAVLLGGASALMPVFAKDVLHVSPIGLGFLDAALPMGSIFCTLLMTLLPPMQKAGRALLWAVIGFGLATIGFGFSKVYWLSFLMLFLCGFADNISVIVRHTLVQLVTPDEMRGRVSAVNGLFIGTSNELGGFESGLVSHHFGPVVAVVSGGLGTILTVLMVGKIWPELMQFGRLDATQQKKG